MSKQPRLRRFPPRRRAGVPAFIARTAASPPKPDGSSVDAELFALLKQWRAAERGRARISDELWRLEDRRAAAGIPEMKRAIDLRRRVAATPAQTIAGLLVTLSALARVQGREVLDDELRLAMAQPELDIDALFFSLARDCPNLAECGALAITPAA
jgi:hypothetical protein